MNPLSPVPSSDEERLGYLAMRFRGTRDDVERRAIAREYEYAVDRLIHGGNWVEIPAPEDQLPEDWMPESFDRYWFGRTPSLRH